MGVNSRQDLAFAEKVVRNRVRDRLMLAGVTLIDPETVFVDVGVLVGCDTVLHPFTFIRGDTVIGERCEIGPGADVLDSRIGDGCQVVRSVVEKATLAEDVRVGPFAHLRGGAVLERGVEIGNFAEVKNSRFAEGTVMHHVGYFGDATVGRHVNVGAGTITCNYDGQAKHATIVGDDAFIGSDTLFVAPVQMGPGARTGAGSVVTHDVAPGSTVYGMPARPATGRDTDEEA
jgi:bifunctional UDP-N-acetylglucosamine pyrophosphorylase/glucosamine-1-phosphate N-acetyltransferase